MKYTALLFTLSLFGFASYTEAQSYTRSTSADGERETITLSFAAPANANFVVYEARPQVSSAAQCFASTDLSSAVPVGPDRVTVSFDPVKGVFYLRNTNALGDADSCSVFLARSSSDSADYVVWRRTNYGPTSLYDGAIKTESENDAVAAQRTRVTSLQVTFIAQTTF
ncbi:MAG TPA: hypothetical protein VJV05_15905 [Pyrinomonadaceae bacterium]|nr:hypothetical protein [Pyrinomonadaceae bacterium]